MVKILWGVIGIWSLFAELIVFYDYLRWRPEKTRNLGTAVKNVFLYRLKMMVKMVVPAILAIIGILAAFL